MRMMKLLAVSAMLAGSAQAGTLSDVIFAPGAFSVKDPAVVTRYAHQRSGASVKESLPVTDGTLIVTPEVQGDRTFLVLSHAEAGKTVPVAAFPAAGGDPVLLYFLESTVRHMAAVTGGSPFYLRNRMRDALVRANMTMESGPVVAELKPFDKDPNRDKMGAFGALVLRIELVPGDPVPLRALSADTTASGGDYRETLTLEAK